MRYKNVTFLQTPPEREYFYYSWCDSEAINIGVLTKGDDTHSNKLRQYYGTTFLRHNIARLS